MFHGHFKCLSVTELEAYGAVVSTLRAQGELTKDRKKLLEDLSLVMKISPERHKAEIRRAVNDEKLCSIAERSDSFSSLDIMALLVVICECTNK